jgi:hypothetical protein
MSTDNRETIVLDLSEEDELKLYRAAHALDITVNQYVERALVACLERMNKEGDNNERD